MDGGQHGVHTVTVIVNESVRSSGPGGIIQTVIRLEQASGSCILTLSNPFTEERSRGAHDIDAIKLSALNNQASL